VESSPKELQMIRQFRSSPSPCRRSTRPCRSASSAEQSDWQARRTAAALADDGTTYSSVPLNGELHAFKLVPQAE